MRHLLLFCIFTCLFMQVMRAQDREDSTKIQILETDSITPVTGAIISLFTLSSDNPLIQTSDEEGYVYYPKNKNFHRISIRYFGRDLFQGSFKAYNSKFYIDISIPLEGVAVNGHRKIVKRLFGKDIINVRDVSVFEGENLVGVLTLAPGMIVEGEGKCMYLNYPISGVRLGENSSLIPLDKKILQQMQSIRSENVENLILKKQYTNSGIQYEIIINTTKDAEFYLSPSVKAFVGKRANFDGGVYTQFSKGRFSSILLLSGSLMNKQKEELILFEDRIKKTSDGFIDEIHNKNFGVVYNGEFFISNNISIGGAASLNIDRGEKNRKVDNIGYIREFRFSPMAYTDQTYSLFSNIQIKQHKIHWESSFNKSIGNIGVSGLQSIEEEYITPNATLDYSFENSKKDLNIDARFSYIFLQSKNAETIGNYLNQYNEHIISSSGFLSWKKNDFYIGAGLKIECSKNNYDKRKALLPKISLGYEKKNLTINVDYAKMIDRPLAWMLSDNKAIETSKMVTSGNSKLAPMTIHDIRLNLSYKDLGIQVFGVWRRDIPEILPVGYTNEGLLIRQWKNVGMQNMWGLYSYYVFRTRGFYAKPNLSLELGRFYNGEKWTNEKYYSLSVPIQVQFGKNKINVDVSYVGESKINQFVTSPILKSNMSYSYNFSNYGIVLTLFAYDILNSASKEKALIDNGIFKYSYSLSKDKRQFGISLSYSFSRGNPRKADEVKNNQNRNR